MLSLNSSSVNWANVHQKCQNWKEESWKAQGLPLIVPEHLSHQQVKNVNVVWYKPIIQKSEGAVATFQARSRQHLYERNKKKITQASSFDETKEVMEEVVEYDEFIGGISGENLREISEQIDKHLTEKAESKLVKKKKINN